MCDTFAATYVTAPTERSNRSQLSQLGDAEVSECGRAKSLEEECHDLRKILAHDAGLRQVTESKLNLMENRFHEIV